MQRARAQLQNRLKNLSRNQGKKPLSTITDAWVSGVAEDNVRAQTAAMQVAKISGGYTEFIEQPADTSRIYETIFAVINNRYTIGYYSTNQTPNGKKRSVKIEVREHPEYTIIGRNSYVSRIK